MPNYYDDLEIVDGEDDSTQEYVEEALAGHAEVYDSRSIAAPQTAHLFQPAVVYDSQSIAAR